LTCSRNYLLIQRLSPWRWSAQQFEIVGGKRQTGARWQLNCVFTSTEVYNEVVVDGAGLPEATQAAQAQADLDRVRRVKHIGGLAAATAKIGLGAGEMSAVFSPQELRPIWSGWVNGGLGATPAGKACRFSVALAFCKTYTSKDSWTICREPVSNSSLPHSLAKIRLPPL